MGRYSGNNLYVAFTGSTLHGDFRTQDTSEPRTIVDASAGADLYKAKLTGQKDGSLALVIFCQSGAAGIAIYDILTPGATGALEWGPEGNNSGKQRYYATAIVQDRAFSIPYEDVAEIQATFVANSEVTAVVYQVCGVMLDFCRACNSAQLATI